MNPEGFNAQTEVKTGNETNTNVVQNVGEEDITGSTLLWIDSKMEYDMSERTYTEHVDDSPYMEKDKSDSLLLAQEEVKKKRWTCIPLLPNQSRVMLC